MWRFSSDIDSLSYKEYGFINKTNSCWATIKTKDNKIYLVGYTDSSQTNSDILIIKTDTAGNDVRPSISFTIDKTPPSIAILESGVAFPHDKVFDRDVIATAADLDGFVTGRRQQDLAGATQRALEQLQVGSLVVDAEEHRTRCGRERSRRHHGLAPKIRSV